LPVDAVGADEFHRDVRGSESTKDSLPHRRKHGPIAKTESHARGNR
jgi:hypothetical protein